MRITLTTLALALALSASACSSGPQTTPSEGTPAASAATTAPAQTATPASPKAAGEVKVTVPSDPCALLPMSTVTSLTLSKAVTAKPAPPVGCLYLDGSNQVVVLYRLSTPEELPGGIESLVNGAQNSLAATATGISVRGFEGYQVSGTGTGVSETHMMIQIGTYVLEVSGPTGEATTQRIIVGDMTAALADALTS